MNIFKYTTNKKATATIEKKIKSSVNHAQPFMLETDVTGEMITYFIDSGGWVRKKQEDGKFHETMAHVKNFLPFLDGPRNMAFDKPPKRKYTRKTAKRGKL